MKKLTRSPRGFRTSGVFSRTIRSSIIDERQEGSRCVRTLACLPVDQPDLPPQPDFRHPQGDEFAARDF